MAAQFKTVNCDGCGCSVTVGSNKRSRVLCKECREARYIANLASLISKSGPQYEANVKATREYYARQARGGTPNT